MLSFFSSAPAPASELTSRPSQAEAPPKRTRVVFAASGLGRPWGNRQGSKLGLPFRTLHGAATGPAPWFQKNQERLRSLRKVTKSDPEIKGSAA